MSRPHQTSGPSSYPQNPQLRNELEPSLLQKESAMSHRKISGSASAIRAGPNALDSSITRLLVVTKQLLQGLEQWSQQLMSEDDVSDIYVRLGNGFELCVNAFQRLGINTQELDSVPQDLRVCLEKTLSDEPSQETLNVYLPEIRSIIFNLLSGLKTKQAAYKRLLSDRQNPDFPPAVQPKERRPSEAPSVGDSSLSIRSTTSGNGIGTGTGTGTGTSEGSISPASTSSTFPTAPAGTSVPRETYRERIPSSSALAERSAMASQRTGGLPSRPAPPDAFRPPRMRAPDHAISSSSSYASIPRAASPQPLGSGSSDTPQIIRHQLVDNPVPVSSSGSSSSGPTPPPKPAPPHPDRFSRDSFGNPRPMSRFSADSDITNGSPIRSPPSKSPARGSSPLPPPESKTSLPPALPILNLPAAIELTNPDTAPTKASEYDNPETRATLAALQRSAALERRASKRFSSYTFNKMVPDSPGKENSSSPQRPMRRADRAPPMPALPESLIGLSGVRLEESDEEGTEHISALLGPPKIQSNGNRDSTTHSDPPNRTKTPEPDDVAQEATPRPSDLRPPSPPTPTSLQVFLQIGKQVKKATLGLPVTLSALRLLFMERFEYDPGMEDFPDVYVRDNRTGVQFELEDMGDLTEGSVLSLNIEPLDQVKQHFDLTFASLAQEIKEMKTALDHSRRLSVMPPNTLLSVSTSSRSIAERSPAPELAPIQSRTSSPRITTTLPTTSSIPLSDLQAQQDEIQNLRRDLAIMRQVHVDFLTDTKTAFSALRAQNTSMREIVKTKMGGSRGLLDNSKAKLESQCQNTIQAVEEISDKIDQAREDAYRRFVTPSKSQMKNIRMELEKATEMVDLFAKDVTLVDPTWRATWASELSRVMEEQRLLAYQNKLSVDLKNDIKDAGEMLNNVQDFVDQRHSTTSLGNEDSTNSFNNGINNGGGGGFGGLKLKSFKPTVQDNSPVIPNLLMEIRTKEGDPNQRLRAIELQQKARERELADSKGNDEFSVELNGFVVGRKLRKTGGTEEAERLRQRRQDLTIKRMLNGEGGGLSPQKTGEGGRGEV